jgi:hypothetical protein
MILLSIIFLLGTGALLAAWSGGLIAGLLRSAESHETESGFRERVAAFALTLTAFFVCVSASHSLLDATSETTILSLGVGAAVWLGGFLPGLFLFGRESSRRHFPTLGVGGLILWWAPRDEVISGTDLFLFGGFVAWLCSLMLAGRKTAQKQPHAS